MEPEERYPWKSDRLKKIRELHLSEILGVSEEECTAEYDVENGIFCVSFDKHKIQVPQILSAVMSVTEVKDVQIQETELSEIVKEIYNHGIGGGE